MAYEFKRLADVEALSEVPENATVLAEVNGAIKRVPGNGLGGSGNTIVIVQNPNYASSSEKSIDDSSTSEEYLTNMSLAEALVALRAYEITGAVYYCAGATERSASSGDEIRMLPVYVQDVTSWYDTDCLMFETWNGDCLYWTNDGISINSPDGGGVAV